MQTFNPIRGFNMRRPIMISGIKALTFFSIMLACTAVTAGDFDGSRPLTCAPAQVHDCLPGAACTQQTPSEVGMADQLDIDFVKKEVRGRYRAVPLPIGSMNKTEEQLILQGTDLSFAWSAVIFLADGKVTSTIADRQGAFVFFGQCTAK